MKIIDFEKKGNVVRFYLGADGNEDYTGDDWDDTPYEDNASKVHEEHIVGHRDIAFPFEFAVLEPKDPEYQNSSNWCKNDMKARKVPCIIAVPKPDNWHEDEFGRYIGDEKTIKFYFGDKMEPGHTLTMFEAEGEYEKN